MHLTSWRAQWQRWGYWAYCTGRSGFGRQANYQAESEKGKRAHVLVPNNWAGASCMEQ